MSEKDIAGVEITVGSSGGGGNYDYPVLDEDFTYPAVLVEVKEESFVYNGETKEVYKWVFELTDSDHEYEVELEDNTVETRRRKVTGTTSKICSPKSKMYKWVSKILGQDLSEVGSFKFGDLYGIPCVLIIKNKEGKAKKEGDKVPIYANVDRIMTAKNKPAVKKKTKKAEVKVEKPKSKVEPKKNTEDKPKMQKIEKIEENDESSDNEAFSDIF